MFVMLASEAIEAEKAKKDSGLDDATLPIYWELKRLTYNDPKKPAVAITEPFRRFPITTPTPRKCAG